MRRRWFRPFSLTLAALTLGIGPWLALAGTGAPMVGFSPFEPMALRGTGGPGMGQVAAGVPIRGRATGCSCREIVVEASNVVRDADIRTGDATVVNRSITYIAPSYGDTDVEIEQEAEAITGDAVAGQILAVDGGDGCSRVRITAENIVEEAEVRSGDAVAKNRSLVLIDPSIAREDLEIEVEQEAVARSGDAVAGQIIGVRGGGSCGGVIVDALNRLRDVEIRSGDAEVDNRSDIQMCSAEGCLADIRRMLRFVDTVDVCTEDGCGPVPKKEFIRYLKEGGDEPSVADDDEDDEEPAEEAGPLERNPKIREAQPWRFPQRTRPPKPSVTPSAEPAASPTPTPTPAQD